MKRVRRWAARIALILIALALMLSIAAFFVLRSQWLREEIRSRIILETEKATGAKAELKKFDFDPLSMRVSVEEFVLHGKESAEEPPFVRIPSIHAGVTIVSFLHPNAYLASLMLEKPSIRIVTYPDGSTNIPGPKVSKKDGKSVFEQFVAISIRHFELRDGFFEYDNQRVPVSLRADNLKVDFAWEAEHSRYRGVASATPFHFNWPKILPLNWDARVQMAMDRTGLSFERAELTRGKSRIEAEGSLSNFRSPDIRVKVKANVAVAEYAAALKLPVAPKGVANFDGTFEYRNGQYLLTGPLIADGLAIVQPLWAVEGVRLRAAVRVEPNLAQFRELQVGALDGRFRGNGEVRNWRDWSVGGAADGFSLESLRRVVHMQRPFAWSGTVSGPLEMQGVIDRKGVQDLRLNSSLAVEPAPGKLPVEGLVKFSLASNSIRFDSSFLKTAHTRLDFQGVLRDSARVLIESSDLNDVLPVLAAISDQPPTELPVQLDGGTLHFEGGISSPLNTPRVQGELKVSQLVYRKRKLDRLSASIDVDAGRVSARNLLLDQGGARVEGDFQLSLVNWNVDAKNSEIAARLELRRASLEELLRDSTNNLTIRGLVSGPATIEGTVAEPVVRAALEILDLGVEDENFRRVRMKLGYAGRSLEIRDGIAEHGTDQIPFAVLYQHDADHYQSGKLTFHTSLKDVSLASIAALNQVRHGVDARIDAIAEGAFRVDQGVPAILSFNGSLDVRQARLNQEPLGDLRVLAATREDRIALTASGSLLGTAVSGNGEWSLRGDAAGLGSIELDSISFQRLRSVIAATGTRREVPFDGTVTGDVVFSGSLRKPDTLRVRANLSRFSMRPSNERGQLSAPVVEELTLRNEGPLSFEADSKGLQIVAANLIGKDTNLQISGGVTNPAKPVWNVNLRGGLNLGLFQNYMSGLRTSGQATVNATVRGSIDRPLLGGRMEIKDATVYHRDLTNGIDKANGVVAFDRNRALLQNLTAQSGGGDVKLNGFITFGTTVEPMSYRVNGQLDRVRIRYPEGTSTTVNANISLTGTSDQSLVGGLVTILRSGFTPRTDIGSLIFAPPKPIQTPTGSTVLRGMQFDVRVVSASNLQLETSLTQGLQAAVDIRLRGSPTKPVVLGTVSVNQGELNFFGTKYNITRGSVSFFNAARIEPVLDMDMETTVRAVTVNINVSGPVDKPNITYRSDPPLQTQDIIALLTVGRTPTGSTVASQSNLAGQGAGLFAGTDTLLGQAVSAGVSSRLQRFFGVSRVKIDPQLVGLETTPQARLTIEQQFSRDITVTYVTNLTGALQQLVRLQWDIRRNWSVVGVRDENGVIGGDILYRKRFK